MKTFYLEPDGQTDYGTITDSRKLFSIVSSFATAWGKNRKEALTTILDTAKRHQNSNGNVPNFGFGAVHTGVTLRQWAQGERVDLMAALAEHDRKSL